MMKTGHVERTNDRDYEVEERRYRALEGAATRLQKEAKGYLDSLRGRLALRRVCLGWLRFLRGCLGLPGIPGVCLGLPGIPWGFALKQR